MSYISDGSLRHHPAVEDEGVAILMRFGHREYRPGVDHGGTLLRLLSPGSARRARRARSRTVAGVLVSENVTLELEVSGVT